MKLILGIFATILGIFTIVLSMYENAVNGFGVGDSSMAFLLTMNILVGALLIFLGLGKIKFDIDEMNEVEQ